MLQILKAKIGSSVSEENALSYPSISNINSFHMPLKNSLYSLKRAQNFTLQHVVKIYGKAA